MLRPCARFSRRAIPLALISLFAVSAFAAEEKALRDTVVGEYRKFATSFTTIHAEDIRKQVEAIYA